MKRGSRIVVGFAASTLLLVTAGAARARSGDGTVTLIHIGDIHGHLVPRPDALGATDRYLGGLARVATVVDRIRAEHDGRALLVNVGDAVQGSAEALFTSGKAVVDVLSLLGVDAYVPGNWDYVYGIDRFVETFVGAKKVRPLAPWVTVASNLYYSTPDAGMKAAYVDVTGERVLPPYVVREVGSVRVGIIGVTTTRGPRALGSASTRGFTFTAGEAALAGLVSRLRVQERADVVVVASELELANNIRIAERTNGIDVVLSADMHELTREPIVTSNGTVIVEEGQDGVAVGALTLSVKNGHVAKWTWVLHEVTDVIPENARVAEAVTRARRPFLEASFDKDLVNPINGARLAGPIDATVGYTKIALHRANPAEHDTPAVLEGSSYDMIADALRARTGANIALVRGFRYGTHVRPGRIMRDDLYHYLPIGAQVAKVDSVPGAVIWRQLESSLQGAIDPDPSKWTGGWFVGMSGVSITVDPYGPAGARILDARVNGAPLDTTGATRYSVAGLWFASAPNAVSNCVACVASGARMQVIAARDGAREDAVEVVASYLASLPDSTVNPALGRVRLVRPLPPSPYGFPEIQPLHGATTGQTPPPGRH